MPLVATITAVRGDLAAIADLGDEATAAAARRLSAAIAPALRVRLLDLVAALARELDDQLGDARVDVRLVDGEPHLVVVPAALPLTLGDDAGSARLTLRLPESLKQAVERAAARDGVSVNGWLTRATKRALDTAFPEARPGRRLRGRGTA